MFEAAKLRHRLDKQVYRREAPKLCRALEAALEGLPRKSVQKKKT